MSKVEALPPEALRWRCAPEVLGVRSTEELEDLEEALGQSRAVGSVQFGIGIRKQGYNIFALGPSGLGKHRVVRSFIEARAEQDPVPSDWCYLFNFREPYQPIALPMPAGRGASFRSDMEQAIRDLPAVLKSAFEGEEYRTRRQMIEEELKDQQQQAIRDVEEAAQKDGLTLMRTPMGFAFAPVRERHVITPQEYQHLPQEEQDRLREATERAQERLAQVLQTFPEAIKQTAERVRALNEETANYAVGGLFDRLRKAYEEMSEVVAHIGAIQADVIENVDAILQLPERQAASARGADLHPVLRRYGVNLMVDNAELKAAPVVYEPNPSYDRLIGRIEHRSEMGTLVTDFQLIRAGALHRARGGYLLLDAHRLLQRPMAYEGMKQALRAGEIRIESAGQLLGLFGTISLEPQPIPLDLKVVLIGDRILYYLLCELDPEFSELFKVAADFEERIDRDDANVGLYARMLATLARKDGLRPFDANAVAALLERSARMAGDGEKLSTEIEHVADLLRESDYWAEEAGSKRVKAEHVRRAVEAKEFRAGRIKERIQEEIERGTILIETSGSSVGQINGLSVSMLGGFSFGRPARITARTRLGRGEVVDIEREVKLGGPLHSKGVMILAGYLAGRYASDLPLSLSASLVFEQSYGGVDGDSASCAELCALLSAIGELPIKQALAITGSVNQMGEVQAIGGVNEKIEGFFDICAARGLTGEQGVLIPVANVKHLMLREPVIEAVREGKFAIYPVATTDEAIELLTGVPAGEAGPDGRWPEDSVNGRVAARLKAMTERRRELMSGPEKANENG